MVKNMKQSQKIKGKIFDIQRFSIHDGPGIRTAFFLKGCPLGCLWCHNPEGLNKHRQIRYLSNKCIGCRECEVCPNGAHIFTDTHYFDRDKCVACSKCIDVCVSNALEICGYDMTLDQFIVEALKDKDFYMEDGGITFSGGEALMQADFVLSCLKLCEEQSINTAIDTSGYVPYDSINKTIPYCDLYLYDIKTINEKKHKKFTGVSNTLILENFKRLTKENVDIWVRVPVVNTFNNTADDMEEISDFILQHGNVSQVSLMSYHKLGASKYDTLGVENKMHFDGSVEDSDMNKYKEIFKSKGINVV